MKKIALIGSTGSIGTQVLDVVRRNPDKFNIVSLSAGGNVQLLQRQVQEFKPKIATASLEFKPLKNGSTEYFFGENAFKNAIIKEADVVVISLVGYKGLIAVLDAIDKGKNIALANKESLVVGGEIVMRLAKEKGVSIVPIDSEHSAVWQSLSFDFNKPFKRIILTASGGAFRDYTLEQLENATAKDALMHPNWNMGSKITVDCATLVNKAFEVAEAKWLYNTTFDKVDVIIHRESIIHSMVEFEDGAVIGQMSYPTMELPIALSLTYPERIKSSIKSLDFASLGKLSFEPLDNLRFPCFDLVVSAEKKGGVYPAIANGANEQAVKLFLTDKIKYNDIYKSIDLSLNAFKGNNNCDLQSIEEADAFSRKFVLENFG